MIVVTLIYSDGRHWIAGSFPTLDAANRWVVNEQAQAYWDPATVPEIVDNTPPGDAP